MDPLKTSAPQETKLHFLDYWRIIRIRKTVILAVFLLPASAPAQTYPSKPVRVIVPFAPGGGADYMARLMGQRLADEQLRPILHSN